MSSEQKTSTLGLSKYQGDEHLLREDFNSDLEKIDTAISEMSNPVETTINDKTISFNTTSNLKKVTLKISADVTGGPILISRNGQTAKPLKFPNDEAVTELSAEIMFYDVVEDTAVFCLAPRGAKLEGNAQSEHVLAGKTFCNEDEIGLIGTMVRREGNQEKLANQISGNELRLKAPKGYYDGENDYVTINDTNFSSMNIRNGINLFGLVGNLVEGMSFAKGSITSLTQNSLKMLSFSVNGLAFTPSLVIVYREYDGSVNYYSGFQSNQLQIMAMEYEGSNYDGLNVGYFWSDMNPATRSRPIKRDTPEYYNGYPCIKKDGFVANVIAYNNNSQSSLDYIKRIVGENPLRWIAFETV